MHICRSQSPQEDLQENDLTGLQRVVGFLQREPQDHQVGDRLDCVRGQGYGFRFGLPTKEIERRIYYEATKEIERRIYCEATGTDYAFRAPGR